MRLLDELDGRLSRAQARLAPHVRHTPLRVPWPGGPFLKCEHRQITGSFKLRGAMNALLVRKDEAVRRGVVAASAGNHGQGVAHAARELGARATVFVPMNASAFKVAAMEQMGAKVVRVPGGYAAAEAAARGAASEANAVWVSPYNDLDVIAGQATVGLEIDGDLPEAPGALDVYVPVGGGGLISGMAAALRMRGRRARVIGVQVEASPYLYVEYTGQSRRDVVEQPTAADGLEGDVEAGSMTIDLMGALVDDMRLVNEQEMLDAMSWAALELCEIVEPSAAAALAAWRRDRGTGRSVVVLSGGNVGPGVAAG